MVSEDLPIAARKKLERQTGQMLRYMTLLLHRMEEIRFPPGDRLYRAVIEAHDKVHGLHTIAFYLTEPNGAGRVKT